MGAAGAVLQDAEGKPAVIGRTLLGTYKLYDRVGSGSFASVYLGRDLRTNNVVAVKILHPQHLSDPTILERFQREAMLAQHLQHPNVVRILDHGEEDDAFFLVMEYVQGHTLSSLIEQRGRLSGAETLGIAIQALRALDAASRAGVIHRDIKPQNMMFTSEGLLKIMDFGLAKQAALGTMTQSGVYMGTLHYMAPEVLRGDPADIRSDLYALGCSLYQCLAGRVPFEAASPFALINMHVTAAPSPIAQIRPDAPPSLLEAIERAMAKEPSARYQTPLEMLGELQPMGAETVIADATGMASFASPGVPAAPPPTVGRSPSSPPAPAPRPPSQPPLPAPPTEIVAPPPAAASRPPSQPPAAPPANERRTPAPPPTPAQRPTPKPAPPGAGAAMPGEADLTPSQFGEAMARASGPAMVRRMPPGLAIAGGALIALVLGAVVAVASGALGGGASPAATSVAAAPTTVVAAAAPTIAPAGVPTTAAAAAPTAVPPAPTPALAPTPAPAAPTGAAAPAPTVAPAVVLTAPPVPSPTAPAAAALVPLLDERFADNQRGWPNDPQGHAWVANGAYHLKALTPGQHVAVALPWQQPLKDVLVSANLRKVGGPPGGGYGIIVRDQATTPLDGLSQGGRYYVLELGDKGEVGIWRREEDRWDELLPWTPSDAARPGSEENQLAVQAVGKRLTFVVNGTVVYSEESAILLEGGVGLYTAGDLNEVEVRRFVVQEIRTG